MRVISWLAANQLASQEGLCTMEYLIKYLFIWYTGASGWFYYRNNITMHDPMNVKTGQN